MPDSQMSPTEYTNRELGLLIKSLSKQVEDGFTGVHERQDKTNGNVKCNKKDITDLKEWKSKSTGVLLVVNLIFIPIVVGLIVHYLK